MKKIKFFIILSILTIITFYGCKSNDSAVNSVYIPQPVNKKVFVELFTNSGCNPCIAAHHYLDQITAAGGVTLNDTSVILLAYHTRYPYIYDSLYQANTVQNNDRAVFYGVLATPYAGVDGTNMGNFSSANWTAQINAELNTTRYLNISLSNSFNENSDSGRVTANISLVSGLPSSDNVIHFVISENNISYITAPNGITRPSDVMRYMITGSGGESINVGQNTEISKNYAIAPNWNNNECYITVFVQSSSTRQIYGVERIKVRE